MVKIKVSYEQPEELAEIIKRLQYSGKARLYDRGTHKTAYLTIDNVKDSAAGS